MKLNENGTGAPTIEPWALTKALHTPAPLSLTFTEEKRIFPVKPKHKHVVYCGSYRSLLRCTLKESYVGWIAQEPWLKAMAESLIKFK